MMDDYNSGYSDGLQAYYGENNATIEYNKGFAAGLAERNKRQRQPQRDRLRDWAAAEAGYNQEWPEDYRF